MSQYGRSTVLDSHRKSMAFSFKKRTEKVDWRKLAAVDVNRIARELDFAGLQESIMSVTFCNIEAEMDSHLVDPNFVKLFQLSQLIIEYLMHSQQFLQSKMSEMEDTLKDNAEGLQKMNKDLEDKQNSVTHLKKENRKARKMLAEYQLMMRSGASGMHKCPFCAKVFVSNDYLLAHIQRRHSEHAGPFINGLSVNPLKDASNVVRPSRENEAGINTELLQELKDIKERLVSTERQLQKEKHIEKEDKELEKIKELEGRYAQWKDEEQQKQMNEMTEFKNSVMIELRQVHEQKTVLEQRIVDLQQKSARPSLVRGIQDEDEPDAPPSKQQRNEMEAMRRQLHEEVSGVHVHAQEEIKRLTNKWKKKEVRLQKASQVEKEKYETTLKQFNDALEAERMAKEKMAMGFEHQMNEINKKILERDRTLEKAKGKPPQAPFRDEVESFQQDTVKPPSNLEAPQEGQTITLYVAFNGTNYQVRRSPSASSRDWSDQFSFNASLEPQQAFDYAIYVYSSGGSPYWRQYISTNPSPPSSEYRLDYVFYVASVPLARTIAYHVLESGSVPVIKSCISKTPQLKGWRDTGITFYVLKPARASSPTKSLNRSGTFMSDTGTEGEDASDSDEISVSSLNTATESAKKNLAEAIELNRSKTNELLERSLPPPPPPPPPDESNNSESEEQSETDGWGTTLETGTFIPFENLPEITTRYNHKKDTLEECKQEVREIFEQSLAKRGIQSGTARLSSKQLESRMESLRAEQEGRAKKFKNFKEIRKRKAEEVNAMARNMMSSKRPARSGDVSQGQQKSRMKSSLKSAAAAIGAVRGFIGSRSSKKNEQTPSLTGRPESGAERSLINTEGSFSATSITEQSVSVSDESEEEENNKRDDREMTMTDEGSDEDTDWDSALRLRQRLQKYSNTQRTTEEEVGSGDESPSNQRVPKVSVHIPSQRSQVQELASSLEKSLERSAENKKPVGAVALIHSTPAGTAQRPASKVELEDFDDDSDFISSSPEPEGSTQKYSSNLKRPFQSPGPASRDVEKPAPASSKKGVKFKIDSYSDFDDSDLDIENIS